MSVSYPTIKYIHSGGFYIVQFTEHYDTDGVLALYWSEKGWATVDVTYYKTAAEAGAALDKLFKNGDYVR